MLSWGQAHSVGIHEAAQDRWPKTESWPPGMQACPHPPDGVGHGAPQGAFWGPTKQSEANWG